MDGLKGDYQFDWTQDPKSLRRLYKSTNFDSIFHKQIAKDVIAVLSPQLVPEPHNLTYDDDLVYKHLIGPLERFICGLPRDAPQETVDNLLDHLKTLKQPSKMCRKVLKTGDVLFSCNDCGFDATCVVCIDCFHKSAHKDHNYRMSNTDGGGCCDCGDVEAWKQHPACSDHQASADQPNLKLSDFEDEHLRMKQIESDKAGILDKISLLPQGYAARFFLICQASLHYARTMLTWYNFTTLPDYLNPEAQISADSSDDESIRKLISSENHLKNYFTVLFNDEVHTYDHVINTLVKIIKCSKSTASIMASSVSREGRSLILQDQFKPCKQVRDAIACVRDSGQGSLKVEVIHGSLLAHQAYALKLIEWIQRMALLCDAFRVLTAFTLLGTYDPIPNQEKPITKDNDSDVEEDNVSLLEKVMRSNTDYWKQARVDWNDLFVTTLLTEYSVKDQFARLVTRNYCDLVQSFMEDDHDHSVSVLTMTTQLYTVPSLTCMLIEEENALSVITQKLIDVCRNTRRENAALSFDNRNTFDLQSLKRGFYIIADIRHLINIEPTKWTVKLRNNVTGAVKIFLNLLDSMQGMDSVKRQLGQHLEYEQEWETGMALQSRLISIISRLVNYCSLDETVLMETLRETQYRLLKNVNYKTVKRDLFNYSAQCIQYDVSASPVSVHLPLTRFAAALIVELMHRKPCEHKQIPYDESLVILTQSHKHRNQESLRRKRQTAQVKMEEKDSEDDDDDDEEEEEDDDDEDEDEARGQSSDTNHLMNSMIDIMEPSLRTAVMIAQFRSGMWRRNGFSLVNQIGYLTGALMRKEMFDRDILVLQECAATCEANKFIIHLLNKFNLFTWVNSELTREPLVGPKAVSFHNDEEIMTQTMTLGEEFLQLLLTIISERYRIGVGKIDEEDVMKQELIQLLCIGSFSRSDITQKLFVNDNEIDCIKTVANLRRSSESSTGKYELKEELYDRFNPFFYHYSRRNQSHALDAQLKRKRNAQEQLICCPPPRPVELTDQFRNLNELLRCETTLIIIQKILRRASNPFDPLKVCSTGAPIRFDASHLQLDQCLHLIGLGLHEQERVGNSVEEFNYLLAAHEKNIFELMRDCYTTAKRSQDLIFWLTRKANALITSIETHQNEANSKKQEEMKIYTAIRECFEPVLASCDAVKQESKRNSELAAQRRARIMAMMKAKQNRFLENPATKQLAAETARHEQPTSQSLASEPSTMTTTSTVRVRVANTQSQPSSQQLQRQQQLHSIYLPPANEPPPSSSSTSASDPAVMDYEITTTTITDATSSVPGASCRINTAPEPNTNNDIDEDQGNDNDDDDVQFVAAAAAADDDDDDDDDLDVDEEYAQDSAERKFIGANHLCILCREEQNVGFDKPTMVLLAYVQRSAVLSKNRVERRIPNYSLTPSNQLKHLAYAQPDMKPMSSMPERYSFTSDNSWSFDATLMPADLFFGPYISTCGHLMHFDCWKSYSDAVTKRETTRLNRGGRHISYELEKDEILCPLCECISNATIPMLPDYTNFIRRRAANNHQSIFGSKPKTIECSSENLTAFLHALKGTVSTTKQVRHLSNTSQQQQQTPQQQQVYDEFKYTRLLQPTTFNDVLGELDEREALLLRDFIATIRRDKISSSLCTKNLLSSIRTLAERIHSNGLDLDKSITDVHHARIFMMTSWSISYSIQAQERTLRFKGWPLFEGLGSAKNLCLESLVRFASTSMMTHQSDMIQSLLVQKLRYLLISEEHLSSSPCCLDIDAFELFVSIYIMLPKLYCHINDDDRDTTTGAYDHEYFRNLLHLMVIFNLLQVLITIQNDPQSLNKDDQQQQQLQPMDVDDDGGKMKSESQESSAQQQQQQQQQKQQQQSDECVVVQNFFKDVILASGHPNNKLTLVDEQFLRTVKCALLPFLRSCAIFLYQMSQIEPSEVLKRKSAFHEGKNFVRSTTTTGESSSSSSSSAVPASDAVGDVLEEFKAICEYLNLPNEFSKLLRSREARNLALTWLRHSRVLLLIKASMLEAAAAAAERVKQQKAAVTSSEGLKRVGSSSSSLSLQTTTTMATAELQQQQQQQLESSNNELMPLKFIHQPHSVNKLIDLPYDYSELVDKVKYFSCPSIKNKDSLTPTLCLVCGVMLCSQSYCCQRDLNDLASNYKQVLKRQEESRQQWQAAHDSLGAEGSSVGVGSGSGAGVGHYPMGHALAAAADLQSTALAAISRLFPQRAGGASGGTGSAGGGGGGLAETENRLALRFFGSHIGQQLVGSCTYHAYECSGGVGVFLRIRNCQILLLSGRSKGCYMAAPYIDDHGETDFGLQRGAPLHLARLHYERLQHSWLSHTIPEQISRILQNSSYASNTQWHLH